MKLYTLDNQFIEETDIEPFNFTGISVCNEGTEYQSKYWLKNGNLHREDGPVVEYANGTKYWYVEGKRHRIDGPACEHPNGTKEWFIHGKACYEHEHKLLADLMKLKGLL